MSGQETRHFLPVLVGFVGAASQPLDPRMLDFPVEALQSPVVTRNSEVAVVAPHLQSQNPVLRWYGRVAVKATPPGYLLQRPA